MTNGQKLRAVGLVVESMKLVDFAIETDGSDFIILGQRVHEGRLIDLITQILRPKPVEQSEPKLVEFRCSPALLTRIERERKSRRRVFSPIAGPLSPSEVLRNVGNYLDLQRANLVRLNKKGTVVTARIQTPGGTATFKRVLHNVSEREALELGSAMAVPSGNGAQAIVHG
jgi:hypothetical protein